MAQRRRGLSGIEGTWLLVDERIGRGDILGTLQALAAWAGEVWRLAGGGCWITGCPEAGRYPMQPHFGEHAHLYCVNHWQEERQRGRRVMLDFLRGVRRRLVGTSA